jgi:hypothetical protein
MIEELITRKEKILILGYKTKGRGKNIVPNRLEQLECEIKRLLTLNKSIISFDNLALNQLNISNKVNDKMWKYHYMGEEGKFSFYIDTVDKKYYQSSTSELSFEIHNPLTVNEMFMLIREVGDMLEISDKSSNIQVVSNVS